VLTACYPEHAWEEWRFRRLTSDWWENSVNARTFLESISSTLGVKTMDDWYKVSYKQLRAAGGSFWEKILE
jgi:hypothetical protein